MGYTETQVRVKSDGIAPDTVIAADIAAGAIGTEELATNAAINTKISQFAQSGSAACVIAGAYVTPAKAYGDANYAITTEPKEAVFDFLYSSQQVAGSFLVLGSPDAQYYMWRTYGPGTTSV